MTKFDIRNYFEKIYNVRVARVNTRIQLGKVTKYSRQKTCELRKSNFFVNKVSPTRVLPARAKHLQTILLQFFHQICESFLS